MKSKRKQELIFSALEAMESESNREDRASSAMTDGQGTEQAVPEAGQKISAMAAVTQFSPDVLPVQPIQLSQASFVYIAPGTFLMGSPEYEPGRNQDEIHHEVTLTRPFFMQSTPVTQRQWKAVMGTEPSSFQDRGADGSVSDEDRPVEGISWHECRVFIQKLNGVGEYTYRLPTEAEWEYACRAGTETPFADGEITHLYCGHDPYLDAMGWYCGNAGRRTHPVARKNANAWGLYDLHGNVSEWCQDWYGDYPSGAQTDPHGPSSGRGRVIRGGSWFSNAKNCRSASRYYWAPNSRSDFIGFRLVKEGK